MNLSSSEVITTSATVMVGLFFFLGISSMGSDQATVELRAIETAERNYQTERYALMTSLAYCNVDEDLLDKHVDSSGWVDLQKIGGTGNLWWNEGYKDYAKTLKDDPDKCNEIKMKIIDLTGYVSRGGVTEEAKQMVLDQVKENQKAISNVTNIMTIIIAGFAFTIISESFISFKRKDEQKHASKIGLSAMTISFVILIAGMVWFAFTRYALLV